MAIESKQKNDCSWLYIYHEFRLTSLDFSLNPSKFHLNLHSECLSLLAHLQEILSPSSKQQAIQAKQQICRRLNGLTAEVRQPLEDHPMDDVGKPHAQRINDIKLVYAYIYICMYTHDIMCIYVYIYNNGT